MEGGTWGIVIIISAFMIQFLAFGVTATIGVYNIELLEYFDGNTVAVSLIASLNYGIFLGSGPIVSYLMTKYSYRSIALFGSALVVLGILGMSALPYIVTMCFCFGVLTGFGSCCAYIPSHVLSGLYYDKNRSLATGIATSGSGLGGAVMPVVAGLLIDHYSWRGSLIVIAGLCLHMFIFSLLLLMPKHNAAADLSTSDKTLDAKQESDSLSVSLSLDEDDDTTSVDPKSLQRASELGYVSFKGPKPGTNGGKSPMKSRKLGNGKTKSNGLDLEVAANARTDEDEALIPESSEHNKKVGTGVPRSHKTPGAFQKAFSYGPDVKNLVGLNKKGVTVSLNDVSIRDRSYTVLSTSATEQGRHNDELVKTTTVATNKPHDIHQSWKLSSSLTSLQAVGTTRGSSYLYMGKTEGDISTLSHKSGGCSSGVDQSDEKSKSVGLSSPVDRKEKSIKTVPRSSRHVYIFTNYGFDVYFLSNIMWNAGCSMVSSFAPEYLRSRGLSSMEAAWQLGAFGFGIFLGGCFGGLLGNKTWINRQNVYTISNVVMGVMLIIFPFMQSKELYLVCLLTAGLAFGVILGLLIVVLTDLIGIESLGNGLGYLMLSNGIGTFIGPPLAGGLKELTGEFRSGIILAGSLCIGGGVVMLLMPCRDLVMRLCGCSQSIDHAGPLQVNETAIAVVSSAENDSTL